MDDPGAHSWNKIFHTIRKSESDGRYRQDGRRNWESLNGARQKSYLAMYPRDFTKQNAHLVQMQIVRTSRTISVAPAGTNGKRQSRRYFLPVRFGCLC
jgi:hypothetical protein